MGGDKEETSTGFRVNDRRVGAEDNETSTIAKPESKPSVASTQADAAPQNGSETFPPVDFSTFVLSISTSCLLQLGDAQLPGVEPQVDIEMARHTIDLLSMLEQKTQGNLTGEEERLMSQLLYDLRMRYVAKSKKA